MKIQKSLVALCLIALPLSNVFGQEDYNGNGPPPLSHEISPAQFNDRPAIERDYILDEVADHVEWLADEIWIPQYHPDQRDCLGCPDPSTEEVNRYYGVLSSKLLYTFYRSAHRGMNRDTGQERERNSN